MLMLYRAVQFLFSCRCTVRAQHRPFITTQAGRKDDTDRERRRADAYWVTESGRANGACFSERSKAHGKCEYLFSLV